MQEIKAMADKIKINRNSLLNMYESNTCKDELNSQITSDNSLPDFLKNEKIDDALKNIYRQEIQIYLHNQETKSEEKKVLGFPSLLSSRSRFMLHNVISSDFPSLITFSIGVEPNRRCYVVNRDILNPTSR